MKVRLRFEQMQSFNGHESSQSSQKIFGFILLLLPASLMTKRFFLAGWPENNQNESTLKARVDEVREKMDWQA